MTYFLRRRVLWLFGMGILLTLQPVQQPVAKAQTPNALARFNQ